VLKGNRNGTFRAPTFGFQAPGVLSITDIKAARIERNDVRPDLIVSGPTGIQVMLNNFIPLPGPNQIDFLPGQQLTFFPINAIAVADINGDNHTDVFGVTDFNNGQVLSFINDNSLQGTLTPGPVSSINPRGFTFATNTDLVLGDANGDG